MNENEPSQETLGVPDPSDLSDRTDQAAQQEISGKSRRAFMWMVIGLGAVFGGLKWLNSREEASGLPWPLRRAHELNETIWRGLTSRNRFSPTFPKSLIGKPRPNGRIGLKSELPQEIGDDRFELKIQSASFKRSITPVAVREMPSTSFVTELRCIEGWSYIVEWTGIPLARFLELVHGPGYDAYEYLYAETPDKEYFVALERQCFLHPQTLLCWAMNGEPLKEIHGAPLRLVVPTKYGIKSLKRVGFIRLMNERPRDYWFEEGYDWYSGH